MRLRISVYNGSVWSESKCQYSSWHCLWLVACQPIPSSSPYYINSLNGSLFVSHWTISVEKEFHWSKLAKYQSEEAQNVILRYFNKHKWSKGLFLVFLFFLWRMFRLFPCKRCIFHQKLRKCLKLKISLCENNSDFCLK